ncbi:hypothetical protein [Anaerofustis sp.]|uniref:hypothetical protein n=1 Tax=Anaerofustis sp. TaxID=1872517 RepID=UPI0025BAB7D5|nr:hypothetical protein [Anaerofustis sp.]
MKKLKWQYKQISKTGEDCSINLCKAREREYVSIILRNGFADLIAPNGYAVCAVDGDRLYFKSENEKVGYKVVDKGANKSKSIQMSNPVINKFAKYHSGDFKIYFDVNNKIYFIDTER